MPGIYSKHSLKNVCNALSSSTTQHIAMKETCNYQRETDGEGDPRSTQQLAWLCGEGEDSVVPRPGAGAQRRGCPHYCRETPA